MNFIIKIWKKIKFVESECQKIRLMGFGPKS